MDLGLGGSAGGSGRREKGPGSGGSERLKRKWSDSEAAMKAEKDAAVKENAEKSAKIRQLMEDKIRLEEEHRPLQGPIRPMPRQNPFVVFPPEVWEMIIEKMNRSSGLEMLCQVFPQLEPLVMKRKKTIVLFKNVLPFLCKENLNLSFKDINNCRLVCGSWNEDMCALFANWKSPNLLPDDALSDNQIATKSPLPDYPFLCCRNAWFLNAYLFSDHRKIQKFLKKMADPPGNPLFGRFLRLYVDRKTKLDNFWKSLLQLVEKFGEHLWSLEITCHLEGYNLIAFYKVLQEVLICLPNLRDLRVHCVFSGPGPRKMADQIGSCPLPPLPYLQSLNLALNSETVMINAFSSFFSNQIHRLELNEETLGNAYLKDESLCGLTNLEYLKVNLKSGKDILRLLKFPSPNLKIMCLASYHHIGHRVILTSGQVVRLLEKFSRLEDLNLTECQVERSRLSSSRIDFSRLKTLKLALDVADEDLQHNLDFLLWFPALKKLEILQIGRAESHLTKDKTDQHSTLKIRFFLQRSQVLDSNIWTLIPSLETLRVIKGRSKVFTRQMFENRVGRKKERFLQPVKLN